MENKHIIIGLRLVTFLAVSLVALCFYALSQHMSLEPVSMIVTALVGLLSGLVGYFWGSAHKGTGAGNTITMVGIAIFLLSCAAGCGSIRHKRIVVRDDSSSLAVTKDSSTRDSLVAILADRSSTTFSKHWEQDTAIGVKGGSLSVRVTDAELDTNGVTETNGTMSVSVNRNRDGSLSVRCTSDSLTLVIKRLQRDSVSQQYRSDSMYYELLRERYVGLDSFASIANRYESLKTISREPWYMHLLLILAGAVAGFIVSFLKIPYRGRV